MTKWCSTKEYKILFAAVAERDGLICRWCGCAVHSARRYPGVRVPDNAATLDHLRPRKHGGDNALENLAMACNRCNFLRDRGYCTAGPITEAQLIELIA